MRRLCSSVCIARRPTTPVDITKALRLQSTPALAVPGPPGGVLLDSGRIAITTYFKPSSHAPSCQSGTLLSDDGGVNWRLSNNTIAPGTFNNTFRSLAPDVRGHCCTCAQAAKGRWQSRRTAHSFLMCAAAAAHQHLDSRHGRTMTESHGPRLSCRSSRAVAARAR